jgi:hypothetical protein
MPPRWHEVTTDSPHRTYPNRVRSSLAFSYPRNLSGSDMRRLGTPESMLLLTCITKTATQEFTCRDGTGKYYPSLKASYDKNLSITCTTIAKLDQICQYLIKERSSKLFSAQPYKCRVKSLEAVGGTDKLAKL